MKAKPASLTCPHCGKRMPATCPSQGATFQPATNQDNQSRQELPDAKLTPPLEQLQSMQLERDMWREMFRLQQKLVIACELEKFSSQPAA